MWIRRVCAFPILLIAAPCFAADDDYTLGPDSLSRRDGVPRGRVEHFSFDESKIFEGTHRDCWIYVPAQYDPAQPAPLSLMVFQDGHAYVDEEGQMRVPVVFDNLIAAGDMPPTAGVFINPGHRGDPADPESAKSWRPRNNRSFEYDSLGDAYARFLLEELLPHAEKTFGVRFSEDPAQRAICGMSSGGICAWTVAWERPGSFGRVLSHIGSFTNIRGGHVYPALIRKTERKAIRVFLQDGSNDLNNLHGNWPLANQEMASALAFAGYDFQFVFGSGAHSGKHGGAILPDSLRWLWRQALAELPKPVTEDNLRGDEALSKIVPDGGRPGDWELVADGFGFTDAACTGPDGSFYFCDMPGETIYRVAPGDSAPSPWFRGSPRVSGMKFGPGGVLYAAIQGYGEERAPAIISIEPVSRKIETVATEVQPNDLVVSHSGWIYFTDTAAGTVVRVPVTARDMERPPVVAGGIRSPNGIALSPDHKQLFVSEHQGAHVWSYVVSNDGSLLAGERLMTLVSQTGREDSGGDGMAIDAEGRLFVTSNAGIQVFDTLGRLGGILSRPVADKPSVNCAFGGPEGKYLYLCTADGLYRRLTLSQAAPFPADD